MAKDDDGQLGVIFMHGKSEHFLVTHGIVPAVFIRKEARLLLALNALAVAEMVGADSDDAVIGKKAHELVVAVNVLGDAVDDLHDSSRLGVGNAHAGVDLVFACARIKIEILESRHGNNPFFVL